ncbi:MAG: cold shock domain-containing protein, partial [Promethearchaeota archaeon]
DQDIFVHYSNIETASDNEFKVLYEGDEVEFNIEQGVKGPEAKHVVVLQRAPRPVKEYNNYSQGYNKRW